MSEQIHEYTPTTEEILRYFDAPKYKIDPQQEGEDFASYLSRVSIETMHSRMASESAARRWLVEHDREVKRIAWYEGASSRQCHCAAYSEGECACGMYPSERNPYEASTPQLSTEETDRG